MKARCEKKEDLIRRFKPAKIKNLGRSTTQTPGKVNYFKYFNRYTCDNIPSKNDMKCIEINVFLKI